ncbi:hypothetical protein [Roseobacter sp. N2S]|uniref:hypothetical protein n=1 Tax=Roseobacter sp. N2S TaxID=2663844 RepID=UPI00285880D4|nr:hypothetical protein [Roseobacter sp. N2S]MDR6263951.1 hypothetical protein [Roseobacter sp. N2S]
MDTGTKISIGLHGVILGLAAFGGPLFDSDESKAIQVSEVSIITSTEFDGMMSRAPAPELQEPQQPQSTAETETAQPPVVEQPVVEQPAPEPQTPAVVETAPDVTDMAEAAQPDNPPDIPVESPEIAEQTQEATGSTLVSPDAQVAQEDSSGQVAPDQLALLRPKPRPAPRVSDQVAPEPPTDAETAKEAVESTTPSETPAEQTETKEEVAPKESTTEIVTEAEEDPNSLAPVKSSRPKGRPSDIVARAQAVKDAAAKAATQAANEKAAADKAKSDTAEADRLAAAKDAQAKAIEAAMKAATSETAQSVGPPLTGSEKGALVLAVQQCWAPPVGVQDAANLVVTLSVELTPDGKLMGSPKLVEPSGTPQGLVQQAYEAGRRALIRCAPYNLPKDKYEQWRRIEVVFNPQNMVVR